MQADNKCGGLDKNLSYCEGILDASDGGRGNPVYAQHHVQTIRTIPQVAYWPRKPEYLHPDLLLEYVQEIGLPREYFEAHLEGFRSYKCTDCGMVHARPIVRGGKYNPYIGLHNAEKSCMRFLRAICSTLRKPYLIRLIITLPDTYTLEEARELAKKLVKMLEEIVYKGKLCARIYVHPTGSQLQYHPHVEIWFLNYILVEDEEVEDEENKKKLVRVRPWLDYRVLRTLLFKLGVEKPQCWIRYYNLAKNFRKCLDDMVYASRPFSFDVYMLLKKGKKPPEETARFCLAYKPRAINLGWATRYNKVLGVKKEKRENEVVCPFCGGICKEIDAPVMIKTHIARVRGVIHEVEGFS